MTNRSLNALTHAMGCLKCIKEHADSAMRAIEAAMGDAAIRKDAGCVEASRSEPSENASAHSPAKDTSGTTRAQPELTGDAHGRMGVGCFDLSSGYSVMGELHTEPKGGEAKRNECDCLRRPDSEGMPVGLKPASPTNSSEMSVVESFERDKAKYHKEWSDQDCPISMEEDDAYRAGWHDGRNSSEIPNSSTEPVSVSLEKCAMAIAERYGKPEAGVSEIDDAKAVLGAAGVKYHE